MKKDYDLEDAFAAIEDELISSMMRNMKRHRMEEIGEEKEWEMWQALQLKSLEEYKKKNQSKFTSWFSDINSEIEKVIRKANETGHMDQEIEILDAIKNGFKGYKKASSSMQAEFFKLNERKLDALIKATTSDMKKAEMAILRMANDQYRKAIFNAQVYANTGAGTYEQAVDMATKDMLASGLNCVEYSNGARHTLQDYADMAIRTASKRAYLQGEGTMRQEWGISTVIMIKRGNPCPLCLPFCGKVLIDDVWSGGSAKDGPYPLMSYAISQGLYHPRCKDSHTTYLEGISTPPDDVYTQEEIEEIEENYRLEQKRMYAKRQADKYGRLAKGCLNPEDRKKYRAKQKHWQNVEYMRNNLPKSFRDERVVGEFISKGDLKKFIADAEKRGVQIGTEDYPTGGFEFYRGKPEVLHEILESLEKSVKTAKNNKLYRGKVILKYDNVLGYNGDRSMVDIDAFAMTEGRTITLNKFMFDDSSYLEKAYAEAAEQGMFTKGTDYRHVINHEFGHIIDKNNKELREKVIKVLRKDAESGNVSLEEHIIKQISVYASNQNEVNGEYSEIIAEIEAMLNGSNMEYAVAILKRVGVKV